MASSEPASVTAHRSRLRRALMRRYPGVHVDVYYNDHRGEGPGTTYKEWCLAFGHADPQSLVRYGLAPESCIWDASNTVTEFDGFSCNHWSPHDESRRYVVSQHIEEERREDQRDRALTKKMQTHVMRLIKPFIRDTWKPRQRA